MIPLYKLEKLPRVQKLRKIAKVFSFAENRLCLASEKNIGIFPEGEISFFIDAAKLLASDSLFSADAQKVFIEAAGIFQAALTDKKNVSLFHRALNNIKHILFAETGREQADWDFTCGDGKLDAHKRQVMEGMQVYLEDIRSPFNVGAMFRTAESFGVEKIILSPFCADPHHQRSQRTSMGCVEIIPWEKQDLFSASDNSQPFLPVFALETGGIPLAEFSFPRRGIMITGSEELGVSPRALAAANASLGRVSIPSYGTKASLNVSVAFGIALQAWRSNMRP
ncbi:MAG: TrmH family RNA methyltransferase [Treponema sp.]|nr:TrmH family RNA methyltransferase [Treponema sp.]